MKTIKLDLPVKDIYRLHQALKDADPPYAVLGVGVDGCFTYINLHDSEERDPTSLVRNLFPPPSIRLGSRNRHGADGVPEALADGKELIEIDVYRVDPATEFISSVSERVKIQAFGGAKLSQDTVELANGMGTVSLGPSDRELDCKVTAEDAAGEHAVLRIRFVHPAAHTEIQSQTPWLKILS